LELLAAFLAGFAVLVVEILGVHLLAPWFGTSSLVWSQQIGLVLAAIALGGWIGGRLARAGDPLRRAARALVLGGLWIGAAGLLLGPFAARLLPSGLTLDDAAPAFLSGSFTAALVFFAPPVLLLSLLHPLLVQARAPRRGGAGPAAGEVAAAGTAGSLLGVVAATFLAVPLVGVRESLLGVAAVLLLAGGLLLSRAAAARSAVAACALLLAMLVPDPARRANLPPGAEVLAVRDSPYQHLRVIEFPLTGERWLQMNEGLDSFQSWWHPEATFGGLYYDLFALAPVYARADRPTDAPGGGVAALTRRERFWVLGFGAGSALGPIRAGLAGRPAAGVGVELDPAVLELGSEWLPLAEELRGAVRVVGGQDARAALRAAPDDLDFVVLDAYTRQFELPLHLATREFFAEIASHLRPGGVLAINVGTQAAPNDPGGLLARLGASVAPSFAALRLHRVPRSRNWVLFARKAAPLPSLERLAELLPPGLPLEVGAAVLPGQTVAGEALPPARPFTDDRNPVTLLQAREWWAAARADAVP